MEFSPAFNVAAKHLFRHLHEPRILRKNPLVRHVFEDPAIGGLGRARERAVLDRIHELVREGAELCRDADLSAGKEERGLRQHAIVKLQCLEQRPIREVAAALAISFQYCYRERAKICRRLARYIYEYRDTSALDYLAELDEFQLLMDHAMRQSVFADRVGAFHECDDLLSVAPSPQKKVEALRTSTFVSLHFGDIERAEEAYAAAQALGADHLASGSSPSHDVARACIDLMGSKLAYYRANTAQAVSMAQLAKLRLEPLQSNAAASVRELYVESLYELGAAFCSHGNLDSAYDCVASAEANLHHVRTASPQLRARIMVGIWKLRSHLLMGSKSMYPFYQRLKGLAAAFEQAYAAGLLSQAATALVILAENHAFGGNDVEALRAGRFAVLLASQQPSERIRVQLAIQVAMMLLPTRYWEYGLSLLPSADGLARCDAYHREIVSYFAAERAFRLHAFDDAWTLANGEQDCTEDASLTVSRQLIAATAAHELERRRDARCAIETAIGTAERLGSAPILRDTYRIAGKVTGDARFKRQGRELARLMTA
jgi:hypothetical protein